MNMKPLLAEAVGTFFLVAIGISSALFSAALPGVGIGLLGVSLAFGLTVTVMAYTLGPISGCHLNPAVSLGLVIGGRLPKSDFIGYVIAQVIGGALGAGAVYMIAKGGPDLANMISSGFASNGFAEHSPGGYSMQSVMIAEVLATMMFIFVILGATHENAPKGFAPIAIGLALAIGHFAMIHVSNASLNPARSTATAIYAGGWAVSQLWVFWVAPLLGGALGGVLYKYVACQNCK